MYVKYTHSSEEYEGVDFLKQKVKLDGFPAKLRQPRGVSTKKKEGILRIMSHVDPLKRKFYGDLFVNDRSEDLVTRFDL